MFSDEEADDFCFLLRKQMTYETTTLASFQKYFTVLLDEKWVTAKLELSVVSRQNKGLED